MDSTRPSVTYTNRDIWSRGWEVEPKIYHRLLIRPVFRETFLSQIGLNLRPFNQRRERVHGRGWKEPMSERKPEYETF